MNYGWTCQDCTEGFAYCHVCHKKSKYVPVDHNQKKKEKKKKGKKDHLSTDPF